MENFKSNFEQMKSHITEAIKEKRKHAITNEELDSLGTEHEFLLKKIFDRTNSENDLVRKKEIEEELRKSTLFCKNLVEFRLALESLNISEKDIQDLLQHENAHGNKASELGANHESYNLTFLIDQEGRESFRPQVGIFIPDEWDKDRQKDVMKKIILAPEGQDNPLSAGDKRQLEQYD